MGFDNGGSSLSCVPLESVSVCFPPLFLLEFKTNKLSSLIIL